MWSFLNPLFLWAASAASIPLILHLLARRRTVRIKFSTVRFLKQAQRQSSHRVKMENLLLWLLRTVLLLLLALAFALPVVRSRAAGFLGRTRRDVAIVWDVSYSMRYASARRVVWDESRAAVLSVIGGLDKGDRACVYLAGDRVTPLVPEPTADLEFVTAQVKSQTAGATPSDLAPALTAACESLEKSGAREREVYVVTDGQALPWAAFGVRVATNAPASNAVVAAAAPASNAVPAAAGAAAAVVAAPGGGWDAKRFGEGATFFLAMLGAEAPENTAAMQVDAQPPVMLAGAPGRLSVRVGRTGPPRDASLTLTIDGQEIGRQTAAASGGGDVLFMVPPLTPGVHAATVTAAADGLELDDAYHLILRARDRLPVLCAGGADDLLFLTRALNPGGSRSAIEAKTVAADGWAAGDLGSYACVFLCNGVPLQGPAVVELDRFVQRGGLLVIFPGDRGRPADYENLALLPAKVTAVEDIPAEQRRRTLRLRNPNDPVFAGLKLPAGALPTVSAQRAVRFGALERDAEMLIASEEDAPFLLSRRVGRGRVLMFAVGADRGWSNFPLTPMFLPVLHQIVRFGAGLGREPLQVTASHDLALSDVAPGIAADARLLGPGGGAIPLRPIQREGGTELHVENAFEPGIYAVDAGGKPAPAFAVNVDRVESDLTPVKPDEAAKMLGVSRVTVARSQEELARQIEDHRVGRPLAEGFLWVAFIVGLLEFWFSGRTSRRTAPRSRMTVELSGRVHIRAGAEGAQG